ncbi:protein-tyrosine kinase 6 [Chanos chanos]|uniref:Tyrosine-protein kinase n=1 Tax=Chanos chanos TaxID=29144 RepID=A0A6J2W9X1_CHACN|nr:protein-tyrosine kinase 6-like [Chanos chanos]
MEKLGCTCPDFNFKNVWDGVVDYFRRCKANIPSKGKSADNAGTNEIETGVYEVHKTPNFLPPQSSSETDNSTVIYKALWSFEARAEDELSFKKGDQFKILERSPTGDWWKAERIDRNGEAKATGFVPHNYLARQEAVDSQPWYFGKLNRFETQSLLMAPGNEVGAFLVRQSEKEDVGCVLSVKVSEKEVTHFKVHEDEEGGFFVDQNDTFSSLGELVEFYRTNFMGSNTKLKEPCMRPEPKPQDLSHITVDDWELPKNQFSLEEQLGSGYFADVYRGKWKGMVNVAIKILKNNDTLDHKEFQLETQILKKLRHRHLISLFAICTDTTPFYIITELMEKGNLLYFLRGQEGRSLDFMALTDMASQVADGMAYLESQNSIHRDLAARNVLVGGDCICKVADFGLARVIKEPFYESEDKTIPYKWSAPEAISHGRFSNKSDVWSFGVLLYEIFSYGGAPYPTYSNHEVFRLISSGYRMPSPLNCPDHIYDIMHLCWKGPPNERPDFRELKPLLEEAGRYSDWTGEYDSDTADPPEGSNEKNQPLEKAETES